MANDGEPVKIPAISFVHGSQTPAVLPTTPGGGKGLPQNGNAAAAAAARPARKSDVAAQVALLNKYLNDSGRPAQFRVDPASNAQLIQEINPATGEVIGEYPAITFPALARSVGISGAVIDEHV